MTTRPSTLVLIAANLFPLIGVAFFEWDVLALMLLYWTENVIVGVINVLRMICVTEHNVMERMVEATDPPEPERDGQQKKYVSANASKLFLIPFFIVHYGGFCFGHGSFIVGIFGPGSGLNPRLGASLAELWQGPFWIAVTAIFVSHLFSFFTNYIGRVEYKNASLQALMGRPYGRIIIMHVAIVFGAGLVMFFDSPMPMLMILIAGKILIDIHMHDKERRTLAADS